MSIAMCRVGRRYPRRHSEHCLVIAKEGNRLPGSREPINSRANPHHLLTACHKLPKDGYEVELTGFGGADQRGCSIDEGLEQQKAIWSIGPPLRITYSSSPIVYLLHPSAIWFTSNKLGRKREFSLHATYT